MKFIADAMLGSLARWLRMLGYDTLYSRSFNDNQILKLAQKEGRIILTRDIALVRRARKKGIKAILIDTSDIEEALYKIALRTGIEVSFKPNSTRCPYCNTLLVTISKAEAISLVPASVGTKYDKFWKCPKCGRVYWQGNHWRTINEILKKVNEKLNSNVRSST